MSESSTTFLGTLTSIESGGSFLEFLAFWAGQRGSWGDTRRAFHENVRLIFSVDEMYHGPTATQATIHTTRSSGSCGFESGNGELMFQKGKQYIIYAYWKGGKWETNHCTRTQPALGAERELAHLRKKMNLPGSQIFGDYVTYVSRIPTPVPGQRVTLTHSDRRTSTATTSPDGQFEFSSLPPGSYTLSVSTPRGYWISRHPSMVCLIRGDMVPCNPGVVPVSPNSCVDLVFAASPWPKASPPKPNPPKN